jgi:ABC-type lipoprotein release transport system permease subunit
VQPFDIGTFLAVTVIFLLVSLAASVAPAYRAARLDPMTSLRDQ